MIGTELTSFGGFMPHFQMKVQPGFEGRVPVVVHKHEATSAATEFIKYMENQHQWDYTGVVVHYSFRVLDDDGEIRDWSPPEEVTLQMRPRVYWQYDPPVKTWKSRMKKIWNDLYQKVIIYGRE